MTRPLGCPEVREGLPGHVRGEEGDAGERAAIEAHLAGCDACRAEATEAGRMRRLLAAARLDPEPRPGGWAELRARVAVTPQVRRVRLAPLAIGAAAAVVLCVGGLWMGSRGAIRTFGQVLVAAPGDGAAPCGSLLTEDSLRTENEAGPTVALSESVAVAFGPHTEARILGPASVRLDRGAVAVTETPGSLTCEVITPYGRISALGTAFVVGVDRAAPGSEPSTAVAVFSGRVRVTGDGGRPSRTLGAGEIYVLDEDGIGVWVGSLPAPLWIPAATWAPRAIARSETREESAGSAVMVRYLLLNPGPGLLALAPPNPSDPLFSATIEALDDSGAASKVHLQRVAVTEKGHAAGPVRLLGPGESWDLLVDVGPGITKPGRYDVVVHYSAPAGAGPGLFVGTVESDPLALEVK